jgi:hypothetical protein
VSTGNWSDPFFRLYRLDTGVPTGDCTESSPGVFTRAWSRGRALVNCASTGSSLEFELLPKE